MKSTSLRKATCHFRRLIFRRDTLEEGGGSKQFQGMKKHEPQLQSKWDSSRPGVSLRLPLDDPGQLPKGNQTPPHRLLNVGGH